MADISVSRKSGGQYTWILVLLAILTVAALMWWLAEQSENARDPVIVEGDAAPAETGAPAAAGGGGEAAELAAIAAAPDTYADRQVQVASVPVAASLGSGAFWADIPGANPFLVVLGPGVTSRPELAAGQTYTVAGTVAPVTEALVNEWVQSGALRAGAQDEASFATHYLLADRISQ